MKARFPVLLAAVTAASLGLPRPALPSLNSQGVDRLNYDAQSLWAHDGLAIIKKEGLKAARAQLVGQSFDVNKKTKATITAVRDIELDCPWGPGVTRLDQRGAAVAVPLQGEWNIKVSADVHVKGKVAGIKVDKTYDLRIELKELRATGEIDFDSSNPAAPAIVKLHAPKIHVKIKIKTGGWFLDAVLFLTRPCVNQLANLVANVGALYVAHKFNLHPQGTPQVIGAGGPALAAVRPADLAKVALRAEDDIFATKMPYGSIWEPIYDKPYTGTWEDSANDPAFDPGTMKEAQSVGDSALMTGKGLAGVAFRFAATGDRGAYVRVRQLLQSTRSMLTMKGQPGNLNRTLLPKSSPFFRPPSGSDYVQSWNGDEWLMSDYISRDAYMGTFYGLSIAHDMVNDPTARNDAREQIEMAIDYLLRNHWTWRKRDGSWGERWAGTLEQQWAWILAANRVNPQKYAFQVKSHEGYADLAWVGVWGGCLDPYYSYYKFALAQGALYTALRLETDPTRFQRCYQSIAILRHYIGHHQNAHFNSDYLALDPSSKAALGAENTNLLTRLARSPRRWMIHDARNDPTIEQMDYKVPFDPNLLVPGQGVAQVVRISKHPIPVDKRPTTGFTWSTSPYKLTGYFGTPNPEVEGEGVDVTLPYWMSRYYGAVR